jgi:hypothetical protein
MLFGEEELKKLEKSENMKKSSLKKVKVPSLKKLKSVSNNRFTPKKNKKSLFW